MRSREGVVVINYTRNMWLCYVPCTGLEGPLGRGGGGEKDFILRYACNL